MTTEPRIELSDAMHGALHEARQLHIALDVDGRPHVTPELFTWSGGKLWFASAPSTYKSRHLESGDPLAAVVRLPARDLLLRGLVERLQPSDLVRRRIGSVEVATATARYAVRNAGDLLAFAGDALRGRAGRRVPEARVLFALAPSAAVLLEHDAVIERCGWPGESTAEAPAATGGTRAVAAFPGPAAVPAQWFPESSQLRVPPPALELYDVSEDGAVAVVLDEYNAPGPAAKSGELLRGSATLTDEPGVFDVRLEKAASWDGLATGAGEAG